MSLHMQLVKTDARPAKFEGRARLSDLISLDQTPEEQLDSTLDYIFRLQDEMKALRRELVEARRTITQKDVLLRNYLRREQALRAELCAEKY
jgi:hypothetical protein